MLDQSYLVALGCRNPTGSTGARPLRKPNLNALRMFDAAARHLNFGLAAKEMNLTQGAVAQQVRRLEADLGFKLFYRKARGLALTEIGRDYHRSIRRALNIIDEATRKLRPTGEQITVSVIPSLASKWFVPRLAAFEKSHPDISIDLLASETITTFHAEGVDVAVRQGFPPFGDGLRFDLLAPLALCAVCSPDYAEEVGPIQGLEDFVTQRLIQDSHGHWDRVLEAAGLSPRRKVSKFNQAALAMDSATHGRGIALVPRLLLDNELAEGTLVELWRDKETSAVGFYVVYPDLQEPSPARDAVIDWILSEAKRSREWSAATN